MTTSVGFTSGVGLPSTNMLNELGLVMGAQQTFRGIMSIVGPVGATLAFDKLGHGVPFLCGAAIVSVAAVLAFRERREEPVAATA